MHFQHGSVEVTMTSCSDVTPPHVYIVAGSAPYLHNK